MTQRDGNLSIRCFSFWLLQIESRDFSQVEKERSAKLRIFAKYVFHIGLKQGPELQHSLWPETRSNGLAI